MSPVAFPRKPETRPPQRAQMSGSPSKTRTGGRQHEAHHDWTSDSAGTEIR